MSNMCTVTLSWQEQVIKNIYIYIYIYIAEKLFLVALNNNHSLTRSKSDLFLEWYTNVAEQIADFVVKQQ
jgi:hypothetical protein